MLLSSRQVFKKVYDLQANFGRYRSSVCFLGKNPAAGRKLLTTADLFLPLHQS
jgi:hypothetical protein